MYVRTYFEAITSVGTSGQYPLNSDHAKCYYHKTSSKGPRHLLEHGPRNPGIYWRPGIYSNTGLEPPAFITVRPLSVPDLC